MRDRHLSLCAQSERGSWRETPLEGREEAVLGRVSFFLCRGWFPSGPPAALPGPFLSTMDSGSGDKDRTSADKWSLFGPRALQKFDSGKAAPSERAVWRAFYRVLGAAS